MKDIEIVTERLILKPLGKKYLETTMKYVMDYENTKYMCYMPKASIEETETFLENIDTEWNKEKPSFFEFAILLGDEHIGAVSIYLENGTAELGWIVNKEYWRNGFAYEAANVLVHYAESELDVKHFIAHCDADNVPSYKIMEKLGMMRTGEWNRRKNRCSDNLRLEYQYELLG